jgi:ATP-binding cassette subfamily C protein EexD
MSAEVSATLRNSEVIAAMGMNDDLHNRQEEKFDAVLKLQTEASKNASLYASIAKTFRVIMQSLLLGLGALLALRQEISPGMMIAGSLLLGRALAPIDMLVATWKGFSLARGQYFRLGNLLELVPTISDRMALPDPLGRLSVEKVTVVPPGTQTPVAGADFNLEPGTALAIIGPSGSGKSSLARTLLGIWPAAVGKVRLDGADIASWSRPLLGPHIGYLPQDIELFNGSIAENICRFGEINPDQTIVAAQNAGVHQLIQNLPQGYDTKITKGNLSGGQRQRIGLARAVYGNPRLVILDEPNSNLDEAGETELINAMEKMKGEGTTVIVITHRTSLLKHVDQILLMNGGANSSFGPRDSMIEHLLEKKKAQ